LLLQLLYSVRSERMLMELLQYNLLFRCAGAGEEAKAALR
jgi:transposase